MTQQPREPEDHGATVDALEEAIVDVEAAAAAAGDQARQHGEDSAPVPGVPEPPD